MATIYSSPGGSVEMHPPKLTQEIEQLVRTVVKGAKIAAKQSLFDIREILRGGIKDNTLGLNPLKPSTLASRAMGKTGGNYPQRIKRSGIAPLFQTGETLRGIKIKIDDQTFSLGFEDNATISYSRSNMEYVTEKHEVGFPIRGTYSKKMLAYLHILFRKQFGKRAKVMGSGHARVGVAYTRTVDPRPAWTRALQRSIPKIEFNFTTAIAEQLKSKGLM